MKPADRIQFTAPTTHGSVQVTAHVVATNLATHHPIDPALRGRFVDLSQVSTGQRVGRFLSTQDAVGFALEAVEQFPELVSGALLLGPQVLALVDLRKAHGGRQW